MANVFAILTAVVLAVSAFLALQNKGTEDESGRGYRGWIAKRQEEQRGLARNDTLLTETRQKRDETTADRDKFDGENTTLQGEVDGQLAKNEDLESTIADKKSVAESKKSELGKMKAAFQDVGDIEEVIAKLQTTQRQLAELKTEIAAKEARRAQLEEQVSVTESSNDGLRGKISLYSQKKSDPNLITRIRSVYRDLGFVTLAGGDNVGVVKDSTLEVVRGGEVVGKLLVTAVEAGTSAADIIPDTFAAGETVVPGDSVKAADEDEAVPAAQ
jgi:hypothetical protein